MPAPNSPVVARSSAPLSGGARLGVCAMALAAVWLGVLPALSAVPSQKGWINWLKEKKVDPSALYYTEVEALEPVLERLNAELTGRKRPSEEP